MKINDAVTVRLNALLKEKNLSTYALCKKIGLSYETLKSIKTGKTKGVTLKTIVLIANGLGTTASDFLNDPVFDYDNLEID